MLHVCRVLWGTLVFLNAVFLSACAVDNYATDGIPDAAGRFSAVTNAYPGVVMVILPGQTGLCTGVVVSERAVMTATHCIKTPGVYTVRSKNGEFQTSQMAYIGDGGVNDENDLGLLIFEEPITQIGDEIHSISDSARQGDSVQLVGFGCNSIETRAGAGLKRSGSNRIADVNDFLVLLTPRYSSSRAIIGDANQAGTCFGDSGGPLFVSRDGRLEVAGITHAGGTYATYYVSEFVDLANNSTNRSFLVAASNHYGLGIDL